MLLQICGLFSAIGCRQPSLNPHVKLINPKQGKNLDDKFLELLEEIVRPSVGLGDQVLGSGVMLLFLNKCSKSVT